MQTNYSDLHPFIFMEGGDSYSLILEEVGDYKNEIFEEREEDGFLGNGYDWEALAQVYLWKNRGMLLQHLVRTR